ncbi:glycosyltransferase involved in cell wall biosynthesis [Pontibacter mucosus]|uniref:Glycosyltransferase involved in cell wall biosynthesis n=1 Tax=Pontibacter mucosus TaxID=1649266 RepID=A0A2T5YE54_9BACT|nr:glycosyltransferase family 4 protein [Pontibacter mucosus]PTX14987.1 glycosyltransferase involved in cell wall biosynthesis [Pontibacter mucosus]
MEFPFIKNRIRVLFFIGNLQTGGKERRLLELLTYLKRQDKYEMLLIMTKEDIFYPEFHHLGIPYKVIGQPRYTVFSSFLKECQQFKPHVIHTWGRMQTLYSLPAALWQRIPIINNQITSAPPYFNLWSWEGLVDKLNFCFSDFILSNSAAGIESFRPPLHKSQVIYNGVSMSRFENLPDALLVKQKYNITTPYTVVMSASFSPNKDYGLFYRIADHITRQRDDITFIGVGQSHDDLNFSRYQEMIKNKPLIKLPGRIDDVEALVNASDIGVLFSPNGEGISNSIIEYMALSKPVIANDTGGNKELVRHNENGYLVKDLPHTDIAQIIMDLIDNPAKRKKLGARSREIIVDNFSISKMGESFERIYSEVLGGAPSYQNVTPKLESNTIV